ITHYISGYTSRTKKLSTSQVSNTIPRQNRSQLRVRNGRPGHATYCATATFASNLADPANATRLERRGHAHRVRSSPSLRAGHVESFDPRPTRRRRLRMDPVHPPTWPWRPRPDRSQKGDQP